MATRQKQSAMDAKLKTRPASYAQATMMNELETPNELAYELSAWIPDIDFKAVGSRVQAGELQFTVSYPPDVKRGGATDLIVWRMKRQNEPPETIEYLSEALNALGWENVV